MSVLVFIFLKEPVVEPVKVSERTQPPGFDNDGLSLCFLWAEPPEHVHYMDPMLGFTSRVPDAFTT